ncbi:serine/threonine-protein kinase [Streptomyces griseosporeus]|uniref:serine/threonine-protein kinase n=1 Tax=Streptomyces griseosporeus TaxID=1910 RepID=UPI0036FEA08B
MLQLRGSGAEPLEADDPRRIGPIPLAGRLGVGGMGRVYLGVHEGRYVAVKQLLASVVGEDADFLRRFGHELDNLARLPEEATAPLLASDRTARPPWFATAYVPGLTLRQAVDLHGGPLPARALWLLLREVAGSLAAVHALDMVHRDLKPSNVMLTVEGVTLIDFGVARAAEQSQLTRTGMVVGTPAYMAPEQASGARSLSGATDVFALGSVLAYAACGRPPFGDESGHGVLYRIVHEDPDLGPLRELDPDLARIVASCLAKDPDGRPTATEVLELAGEHGPFETPLWPAAVTEHLAERAAFAAEVQRIDVPTLPLGEGTADAGKDPSGTQSDPSAEPEEKPEAAKDPGSEEKPGLVKKSERGRRRRVFLAVVPVVVVVGGATLAIQNLPYTSEPPRDQVARSTASATATAPGAGTSTKAGATPSVRASAATSPSQQGQSREGVGGSSQGASSGGTGTSAGGSGDGAAAGAGGSGSSGGTSSAGGSGGASGSGGSGGSAGSGTSGGTTATAAPAVPAASGTARFRNGANGHCITQVFGAADHGSCSDASATWTVRSTSDGGFRLVNQQSGQCLYANGLGQAVFVGDCALSAGRVWRAGSGNSLRSDYSGGCLDLGTNSGLVTAACAGEASQQWTRQG